MQSESTGIWAKWRSRGKDEDAMPGVQKSSTA
jgi:hypothetical protein